MSDQEALFEDFPHPPNDPSKFQGAPQAGESTSRSMRVENSALWAAWADALGFISELTTESGLRRRLKGRPLSNPVEWHRRVGGRSGPDVLLPAGTYSDDTQLRLASGRCLRGGQFDVEAFAHVELTAWLAYALGGGKGTKAAATRMMGANSLWYAGHADGWTKTGGNGAAMRIQPHVWASNVVAARGPWLSGLLADATVTHAHPRALLGAVFHAYALSLTVAFGDIPAPTNWNELFAAAVTDGLDEMHDHPEIGDYWIGAYNTASHREDNASFDDLWVTTADEMHTQIKIAAALAPESSSGGREVEIAAAYRQLVVELGLHVPQTRGSGSGSAIAALWLARATQGDPALASRVAAADITTDTDTIATMAAALAGATTNVAPPAPDDGSWDFSDQDYIRSEARRLGAMASGSTDSTQMHYPDLLGWALPKAQVDLVGIRNGQLFLAGMSKLHAVDVQGSVRGNFAWTWCRTGWGQHILIKHRTDVRELPEALLPSPRTAHMTSGPLQAKPERPVRHHERETSKAGDGIPGSVSLGSVFQYLEKQQFSDAAIAYTVRRLASIASESEFTAFGKALYSILRSLP